MIATNGSTRLATERFCEVAGLGLPARALVKEGVTLRQCVVVLDDAHHSLDAARVLAFALPKREAVWWAWVCSRVPGEMEPHPAISAALLAAERWVEQPDEVRRRGMLEIAERAGLDTAAGCAALSAYMSGGSLSSPELPVVPPDPLMTPKLVVASLIFASLEPDPARADSRLSEFVKMGLEMADRTDVWSRDR